MARADAVCRADLADAACREATRAAAVPAPAAVVHLVDPAADQAAAVSPAGRGVVLALAVPVELVFPHLREVPAVRAVAVAAGVSSQAIAH